MANQSGTGDRDEEEERAKRWNAGKGRLKHHGRTAALLLAGAALLAAPAQAAPTAPTTYVSNIGKEDGDGVTAGQQSALGYAQTFTTGARAGGYALGSVDISVSPGIYPDPYSASVCATDRSGLPTDTCWALARRSDMSGVVTFARENAVTLNASTTYAVVVRQTTSAIWRLGTTVEDDEDSGAASGWSIGDNFFGSTRPTMRG